MSDHEERLDQYINALNSGRVDSPHASDPELAGLLETARQLHALNDPAAPDPDFPAQMAARLADQLRSQQNGRHSNLDWVRYSTQAEPGQEALNVGTNPWRRGVDDADHIERPNGRVRRIGQYTGAVVAFAAFALVLVLVFRGVDDGFPTISVPGDDSNAALPVGADPSDVGQIAFTGSEDGNEDIYLINADGSGLVNLTSNPANDMLPSWSPDGSRITFASDRDGQAEIYVMDADGSNLRRLTQNVDAETWPLWSPDGQHIAFVRNVDSRYAVYVMNADGSDQHALTSGFEVATSPLVWSPDSTRVGVAISSGENQYDIRVIDVASGDVRALVHGVDHPHVWPSWSADGARLAVTSSAEGQPSQIYTMNVFGVDVRTLGTPDSQGFADWSPIGRDLVFVGQQAGQSGIYVANLTKEGSTRLVTATDGTQDLWPVWSPDANQIAFIQAKSSNHDEMQDIHQLMTVNADGSGLTSLSPNTVTVSLAPPVWRPTASSTPAEEEPTPTAAASEPVQTVAPIESTPPPIVPPAQTTAPEEPPAATGELITLDDAIQAVRDFLGDPNAELTGDRLRPEIDGPAYQIMRQLEGSIDIDMFIVDARTGAITQANIPSNTTRVAPASPITVNEARDIATTYARQYAPNFDQLTLHEESDQGIVAGVDGEDRLFTMKWQLQAPDSGAWLPTWVTAGVDLDTGLLNSFSVMSTPYDGPTAPTVSEDEATAIARDEAAKDPTFTAATIGTVELTTVSAEDARVLVWSVGFDFPDSNAASQSFNVDALSGEVLNPVGTPAG